MNNTNIVFIIFTSIIGLFLIYFLLNFKKIKGQLSTGASAPVDALDLMECCSAAPKNNKTIKQ